MQTIAYASTANADFSTDDFAELLTSARARNAALDITGVLLYRNRRFIQVLEGPHDAVAEVYASIVADPRHREIILLADDPITVRKFATWRMAYRPLTGVPIAATGSPEDFFDAYPLVAHLPENVRRSQTLFDWLYDYWLTPDPTPVAPSPVIGEGADATARPALRSVPPRRSPSSSAGNHRTAEVGSSAVVTAIFDKIMADVNAGVLLPGDILRDAAIAEELGTSRTPVREALQKLRSIGVVEASANRFTRIAVVDSVQAARSVTVLAALFGAVLNEVIGQVGDQVVDAMRADRLAFQESVANGNASQSARFGADFYLRLVDLSSNQALKQGIQSVVHIVQLGSAHLDELIGLDAIAASQDLLLAATIAGDLAEAHRALAMLSGHGTPPSGDAG